MKGFEAGVSKSLGDRVKASFQFTYTQDVNPELGRQVNEVPERKYSVGLNYAGGHGLNANLSLNYIDSRFIQFSDGTGSSGELDPPSCIITLLLPCRRILPSTLK
ncbi:hypothetical protein SATMO3_35510 [Sporomusa aerivorans]